MSAKHVLYPIIATTLYLVLTFYSQWVSKDPVMPTALDWTFPDAQRSENT
jgi:hypothetical protein